MFIYLLLYIVCDSSSGYVFACVLYVICLLYSHLTSVCLNFSSVFNLISALGVKNMYLIENSLT